MEDELVIDALAEDRVAEMLGREDVHLPEAKGFLESGCSKLANLAPQIDVWGAQGPLLSLHGEVDARVEGGIIQVLEDPSLLLVHPGDVVLDGIGPCTLEGVPGLEAVFGPGCDEGLAVLLLQAILGSRSRQFFPLALPYDVVLEGTVGRLGVLAQVLEEGVVLQGVSVVKSTLDLKDLARPLGVWSAGTAMPPAAYNFLRVSVCSTRSGSEIFMKYLNRLPWNWYTCWVPVLSTP